jgi:hypothetical protein
MLWLKITNKIVGKFNPTAQNRDGIIMGAFATRQNKFWLEIEKPKPKAS